MKRLFRELRYKLLLRLHKFLKSFVKHDLHEIIRLCGPGGPGYHYNGNLILKVKESSVYDDYLTVLYKAPSNHFRLASVKKEEFLAGLSTLPDGKHRFPLEEITSVIDIESPKSERMPIYDADTLGPYEELAYMRLMEQVMKDWDEALLEEERRNAPPKKRLPRAQVKKTRKKK